MNTTIDKKNWSRFSSLKNNFSILAPSDWTLSYPSQEAHVFQVCSADNSVVVTLSAYGKKPGSSVREFADFRYSCVDNIFKQKGDEYTLENGFYRLYEVAQSDKTKPVDYLVAGVDLGSMVISFSIVIPYKTAQSNLAFYEAILLSVSCP